MLLEIAWKGHTVLHDLKLNLHKSDGTPYRTVVIAGENGTGKTSILTSINDLMKGRSTPSIDYVTYEFDGALYTVTPESNNPNFGFYYRKEHSTGVSQFCPVDQYHHKSVIEDDPTQLRYHGCLYLSARSGFKTSTIKSTTTRLLDTERGGEDEDYDYTEIKQLFVDLDEQDAQAYRKVVDDRTNECGVVYKKFTDDVKSCSKMSRFTVAFNDFFYPDMKFQGVDNENGKEKTIRFIKNEESINIDELSTGEKQIVFRGAFCLKNSKVLTNGLILIDEPELSMHPKWQKKIFKYYRNIFSEDSVHNVQMIVTTHSDHVVSEALSCNDDVKVIVLKNENGNIIAHDARERVLPMIQPSEVNYIAFGLSSYDYFLALYCRVQEIADEHGMAGIEGCDRFIMEVLQKDI